MKKRFHIDRLTLLIAAIGMIFTGLLIYLVNIDRDIEHYHEDTARLYRLHLLDDAFDAFLLQKIQARNYETINKKMSEFEDILDALKRRKLSRVYGTDLQKELNEIEALYEKKRQAIEHFKSYNAAAINSLHYLFDLRKSLMYDASLSQTAKEGIEEIHFGIMQMILGLQLNTETLQKKLNAFITPSMRQANINLLYYYNHIQALMENLKMLHETARNAKSIDLEKAIESTQMRLDAAYERKISIEKAISLLFFLTVFALLVYLTILHKKAQKTYRELRAFVYAVENSDNSIVMTDPDRHIVYVNDVFEKSSGYTREEALGENPRILKSGEQDQSFYDEMNRTLDRGEKWKGEFINKRKDGSLFYEKASIVPVYVDGELTKYLAIKLDITRYVEQQKKLELSAAVFENAQESIMITDSENRIVSVNHAFTVITGYSKDEVIGRNPNILKSGRQDAEFYKKMWRTIHETGKWHGKIYNRTKDGEIMPAWLTIATLRDKEGDIVNYIAMVTDLREIISSQERAEYLAYHDTLTGLPNRAYFEEYLHHAVEMARRNETVLAVLFIDLDRFKVINDTLGHEVGDLLLQTIARRLRETLRESDTVARVGGDEFIAVIETVQSGEDVAVVCRKLLHAMAQPIRTGNHTLNVSGSIGVALFPDHSSTITELIKHADSAMYLAKQYGKNNFRFYRPELTDQMQQRLQIEQGLSNALVEREFHIELQPQYVLHNGEMVGAEVLLRWHSPDLGNVPPDQFIPVAEETGKIIDIGKFVFEASCRALADLDRLGIELASISVNVSSRQFAERSLPEIFEGIAASCGVATSRITLEMTERYIMDTATHNDSILTDFRNRGFKISVDDFGTGYSSMSYLKRLPIDTIKIDKSFIDDVPGDPSDCVITKAIIALSESLGYRIVAEGIENDSQEQFLVQNRCRIGQGYLYAKPLPFDQFVDFCRSRGLSSAP